MRLLEGLYRLDYLCMFCPVILNEISKLHIPEPVSLMDEVGPADRLLLNCANFVSFGMPYPNRIDFRGIGVSYRLDCGI